MRLFRRGYLAAVLAAGAVSALFACSRDGSATGSSAVLGADVIVSGSYDGATFSVVRVAPDDHGPVTPAPDPGAAALTWTLADASGKTITRGTIADLTRVTSEFAADGNGAPVDGRGTAFVDIRVPYVAGSTLSLTSASGGSVEPSAPHVELQDNGICTGVCPPWIAPVPAPTTPPVTAGVTGLKKVVDNGECVPFNILLVSEGFQSGEMGAFEAAAQKIGTGLTTFQGYATAPQDFNVWILEVSSIDSGLTDPGCTPTDSGTVDSCPVPIAPAKRDTAFGATLGDNVTFPRRLITLGTPQPAAAKVLLDAQHASRSDMTGFLVNDPNNLLANYGGSANIPGRSFTTSTYEGPGNSPTSVAAHEIGHALFGFQDEYSDGETMDNCTKYAASTPPGGRGPFPFVNVTDTPSAPPWGAVESVAPIAGAYYCTASFYRAESTCLMRDISLGNGQHNELCKVCLDHLTTTVKAKETWAKCSCARNDAGIGGGDGGGLLTTVAPLVCPGGGALVQQQDTHRWWPF